ncbi:MJ0042-type zinc finger domain-containing protein [Azohydromonas sediminis]|uniref:MJ0042-type zinc finger domain-containing protein n=1 Tax=Azohydromonas sediminis TaxID=2259674 RepID=UPI000E65E165|nr:MJ0042-type zinc finger domain-containing protein [Azohydromonas sediminis]
MGLADGIRKHGFRKWYERELLGSHAWLVLTFLCTIGLVAAFEGLSLGGTDARLGNFAAIGLCGVVGVVALRRYLYRLMHAEQLANQAVCAQCQTYGRLEVTAEEAGGRRLRVRCRHCAHEWSLEG